jgi:hypothetical protein
MSCLLGHHYIITAEGTGGYQYCGVVLSYGVPMLSLTCTKCGKKKVVET